MKNTKFKSIQKKSKLSNKKAVVSRNTTVKGFGLGTKALVIVVVFAAIAASILYITQAATPPYKLYMSPDGRDTNSGTSPKEAVATINQVQKILEKVKPKQDVEVRIKQGTYLNQSVEWKYFIPGHTISFMPANYNYGDKLKQVGKRPKFVGNKNLQAFFRSRTNKSMDTNIRFYYLQIEKYWAGGIVFNGGEDDVQTKTGPIRRATGAGLNRNTFYGLYIKDIGNKPVGLKDGKWGFAGIQLSNSSNNIVENNVFENLVNDPGESHIHGLYIIHSSNNNKIRKNVFRKVSGSPIKFRNSSNKNIVDGNRFVRTGIEAAVYDSHQEGSERTRHRTTGKLLGDECSSVGNIVRNNLVGKNYVGNRNLPLVSFRKGDNKYPGKNKSCPSLNGELRVKTNNNKRIN